MLLGGGQYLIKTRLSVCADHQNTNAQMRLRMMQTIKSKQFNYSGKFI